MKQLNKFIIEKLTLNNQSKLKSLFSSDDISDYDPTDDNVDVTQTLKEIRKVIGFDMNEYNEYPYKIIKEWISYYNIDQIEIVVNDKTYNEFLLETNESYDTIDITTFSENTVKKLFTENALNEYFHSKEGIHVYVNKKNLAKCLILSFEFSFDKSHITYNVLMYNRKLTSNY